MGRKIEIKRIENLTRRQVTYSKRRSSLIKKANEISVFCDIDVLFITFSHSGRINTFCSRDRMEDVIERYMNLPPTSRYPRAKNIQGKVLKLKELDHIIDDEEKLHHLDNEIEQLEEQIKKKKSEIEILLHKLKEFEPDAENATLSQVMSLEEHFKNSLKLVKGRKKSLVANPSSSPPTELTSDQDDNDHNIEEVETVTRRRPRDHIQHDQLQTVLKNIDENQLIYELQDPTSSQILLQLDPWLISNDAPNCRWSRARGSDLIIEQSEETSAGNVVHGVSNSSTDSLPTVTTGFPSNADQLFNWFIPQTNISTHCGLTEQPLTTTTAFPNQQMWGSSSSFGLALPENSSGDSGVAPAILPDFGQFGAITTDNQVNWFNASGSFEPYSMTNFDAANYIPTTINGNGIFSENNNGSINAASFDQVIPEAVSSVLQAETMNSNNMGTIAAGNQDAMDDGLGWDSDDSILLEKVNFEDLETIFD